MKHKRILKWVNRIRKEYLGKGPIKRMPRGRINEPKSCPVHDALWPSGVGGYVRTYQVESGDNEVMFRIPKFVSVWIRRFDAGKYPELIKE